ncbi:MAG: carbohydrate kinase family protein [Nanoarchaeota archaeon]
MSLRKLPKIKLPKRNNSSYDVITVGSGTVDVFVNTDAEFIKKGNPLHAQELMAYPVGSKLLIDNLRFEIGGGGTNTAVAFARFGLKTGWIGSVGKCENSKNIIDLLNKEKIDFLGRLGNGFAGYSVILDSVGHDRTILTFKGENNNLKFSDIPKTRLKTKWFYFCSMVGTSFTTQKQLARYAGKNKIKLAFNPSSYQAKLGTKALRPILKNSDLLVVNKEEAGYLVGHTEIETMMQRLHEEGPGLVIITDGQTGAYCSTGDTILKAIPRNVRMKETTGAGDAFASSFLGAYMKTEDIRLSLKLATTNAQSVIQYYGAKNILLTWKDAIATEKKKKIMVTTP